VNVAKHIEWLEQCEKQGLIYQNQSGIYISKEFPEHERNSKWYKNSRVNNNFQPYMKESLELLKKYDCKSVNVMEIGAGVGVFANMYISIFKPFSYTAYEFAHNVEISAENYYSTKFKFISKDIDDITLDETKDIDMVIAQEVLEHVVKDKEFINKFKPGTRFLITIPKSLSKDHVRCFPEMASVFDRYDDLIHIAELRIVDKKKDALLPKWWCFIGVKK